MWFVIGAISGLIGWVIGKASAPTPIATPQIVSGEELPQPSPCDLLSCCIQRSEPFPEGLIHACLEECTRNGDIATYNAILQKFSQPSPSPERVSEPQAATLPLAIHPSLLRDVPDEEWSGYVASLVQAPPEYSDERSVGMFRQHKRRLQDLGIDPTTIIGKPEAQYDALAADMQDTLTRNAKLINHWAGDVLSINGQQTPVTRSGLLTLIKCAGSENAKSWLSDDGERLRFPHTTQQFLATNGRF